MEKIACFTSITFSYLSRARLLVWSLKRFHPEWHFVVVITDKPPGDIDFPSDDDLFDEIVWGQELPVSNINSWMFKHNIVEVCTAVKGTVIDILANSDFDKVIYLDPDIAVFNTLQTIIDLLDKYEILLTPHQLTPDQSDIAIRDNEIGSLKHGIYNLGFVAIRCSGEGLRFAEWWANRLLSYCYDDPQSGLFTDQRWCDHVPVFFDNVHIIKDPGYNVASWNLSNREIEIDREGNILVNGMPLRFYHLTKFSPLGEVMTSRYALDNIPVYEIWAWYRIKLASFECKEIPKDWWYYGVFENGDPITSDNRLLYRQREDLQGAFGNPFLVGEGSYHKWLSYNT